MKTTDKESLVKENKINSFPPQSAWTLPFRDRVRGSVIQEALRIDELFLHIKMSQMSQFGHLVGMLPQRLP